MLPSQCALCGSMGPTVICGVCEAEFFKSVSARCEQCALPLQDTAALICGACLHQPPSFDATVAAVDYAPPIDQLVIGFKFGAQLALSTFFSKMLLRELAKNIQHTLPDLLIPVPLSEQRLVERGFNQALEIAKCMSRQSGIELAPRLAIRVRHTHAQSLLSPSARLMNVRNAFSISADQTDRLNKLHIGLVDDVMTTGETLNEMAALLKRFGASRVTALVFARTALK